MASCIRTVICDVRITQEGFPEGSHTVYATVCFADQGLSLPDGSVTDTRDRGYGRGFCISNLSIQAPPLKWVSL